MTMKILLTGAAGQLGIDTIRAADARRDVDVHGLTRREVDITDVEQMTAAVAAVRPDVVVHAAAWTAVDACEGDPTEAMRVNATGTATVAQAARAYGARTIFVSTDYVFDGHKSTGYLEDDATSPVSVYGRSKAAGEAAMHPDDLIVRTSWVFGTNGANMVKTIVRLLDSHPTLTFVDDQIGCPTYTVDLANALLDLAIADATGVCHVTNSGVVSWYEFCRAVLEVAGEDPTRVRPCATHELDPPRPAPRPANSVLTDSRLSSLGLEPLRDFRVPLAQTVDELRTLLRSH